MPTVLIYSGDQDLHVTVQALFAELAVTVVRTTSRTNCLDAAGWHEPDLLLLDLDGQGDEGILTLTQFRRLGLATPVLVITSQLTGSTVVELRSLGIEDFIIKPVRQHELLRKVKSVVNLRLATTARPMAEDGGRARVIDNDWRHLKPIRLPHKTVCELLDGTLWALDFEWRQLVDLAGYFTVSQVQDGDCIFQSGAPPCLVLVIDGGVEILKSVDSGPTERVTEAAPGTAFGEHSLVNESPHEVSAVARGTTRFLLLTSNAYQRLQGADANLAVRVVVNQILRKRIPY